MRKIAFILTIMTFVFYLSHIAQAQQSITPEKCVFPTIFTCSDYLVIAGRENYSSISLKLTNGAGKDVNIMSFNVTSEIGSCYADYGEIPLSILGQETKWIILGYKGDGYCNFDNQKAIGKKKFYLQMKYIFSDSTYIHTLNGELFDNPKPVNSNINYQTWLIQEKITKILNSGWAWFFYGHIIFILLGWLFSKQKWPLMFTLKEIAFGWLIALVFGIAYSTLMIFFSLAYIIYFIIGILGITLFPYYLRVNIFKKNVQPRYTYALMLLIFYILFMFFYIPLNIY